MNKLLDFCSFVKSKLYDYGNVLEESDIDELLNEFLGAEKANE